MNTHWFKSNWGWLVFGLAFLAALGGLILLERQATSDRAQVQDELNRQQQRLDQLRALQPFPSTENIRTVKDYCERLLKLYQQFHAELSDNVVEPPTNAPTAVAFGQLVREKADWLTAQALDAEVVVPPKYGFGFGRYVTTLPCKNPPAAGDECARLLISLGKQLRVCERLALLMISNKVEQVGYIHHTELEPGGSGDSLASPIVREPRTECTITPYELQFTCSPAVLQSVLNALTRSEWVFAVRNLTMELEGTADSLSATPHRRLKVTLRLDHLEFHQPKPKPTRPPPAGRT